jgi:hypothetical protein
MTRPKILILGNSHTRMMSRALAARRQAGVAMQFGIEICWLTTPGRSAYGDTSRDDAMAKVKALTQRDLLAITWLGTAHNVAGLLEHEVPFSLAETVDGPVDAPAGTEVIPLSLMRAMLENWIKGEDVVSRYGTATLGTAVHIMAPPPKQQVKARPKTDESDTGKDEMRFSAPQSRLAFWKLEAALVRRYVTGLGVRAFDYPPGTADPGGFLLEAHQAPDATHANTAYGELCLAALEAMAAETLLQETGANR